MTPYSEPESEELKIPARPRQLLSWKVSLLVFGLLTAVVLAVFFWQLNRVKTGFRRQALSYSKMVAGIIEENLRNSLMAGKVIDETLGIFLYNSAKFTHYLDEIEPFSEDELSSLARESGLAGITIVHPDTVVSGPADWLPMEPDCFNSRAAVDYISGSELAILVFSSGSGGTNSSSCLIVGLNVQRVRALKQKTGLPAMLQTLSSLPGISYIRLELSDSDSPPVVRLVDKGEHPVAETSLHTQSGLLVVGFDARQYRGRVLELQEQFIFFGVLLLLLGAGSSWLFYRYQREDLQRTRDFERLMARNHEEASMGRATATIAHEIRNPLNAINIGLQRLVMESFNLSSEQEQMLYSMRESVKRTESIISRLQRFSRPLQPELHPVRIDQLLEQTLNVYKGVCRQQSIQVKSNIDLPREVMGDRDLLGELLDNLVKNSIEAQPNGGFLSLRLVQEKDKASLTISNGGFVLDSDQVNKMTEPYFTTKTRGTGLGLALSKRIVEAHSGSLTVRTKNDADEVTIMVMLPINHTGSKS